jgi:micrococcal nuclease
VHQSQLPIKFDMPFKILTALVIFILAVPAYAEHVLDVIDGDTLVLTDNTKVRLAGIDAPEIRQPYGLDAKSCLASLVNGKEITMDCSNETSYGRKICKVFVDTLDVQKTLVEKGLAFDYTYFSHGKYLEAEEFAHKNRYGVWSGGIRPWDYRHHKRGNGIGNCK